ncbi:MAG: helix-turn-helix transcriptional regulator [Conexivisphaera sp.]
MGQLLAVALLLMFAAQSPLAAVSLYPSGYAHVVISEQVVAFHPVNISLIGQPEALTVSYSNGSPVSFALSNGSVQLIPGANGTVYVDYYTFSIVEKNPVAWFANFTTPYPTEISLPYNASLVYINSPPAGASVVNDTLVLDLTPGSWEISYTLPVPSAPGVAPSPSVPSTPTLSPWLTSALAATAAAAVAVVAYVTFTRVRRRPAAVAPRDPDDRILDFLRRSGGSATEAEIRRALVIPKTTCWRAIKRLEREGLVRVERRDKENVVHLIG